MKIFICLSLLTCLAGLIDCETINGTDEATIRLLWREFKLKNKKLYQSSQEELVRYDIWKENYLYVLEQNKQSDSNGFSLGLNSFCDLSQKEVSQLKFGLKLSAEDKLKIETGTKTALKSYSSKLSLKSTGSLAKSKDSVNWVIGGFVSSVKDQGNCGACWSFVSTGALESQLRIKQSLTATLSEQNLIDCSVSYGNEGCDGGLMSQAFEYVRDNKGINPDSAYKYIGSIGTCRFSKSNSMAPVTNYINLPVSENSLREAVATIGPVAVGIDADHKSFTLYKGGVYFEPQCSSVNLNHAVLVVGYGQENGQDYWLIKNSWGTSWGEAGFGKIARNKNNHCGIASLAGYPVLA